MAKVKKLELEKQEWIPFCTITLSKREAHALLSVAGCVNGNELFEVYEALKELELPPAFNTVFQAWENGLDKKMDAIYGKGTK